MSRLDLATGRLQAALERLENTAAPLAQSSQASGQAAAARVAELEAEREHLLARIAVLEDDMAALTGIAEEVENRLDGAIGEFRSALAR
jgi:chromosome segregation ATPase